MASKNAYFLAAAVALSIVAPSAADETEFSLVAETQYAYGLASNQSQSMELELRPELQVPLTERLRLLGSARFRVDAYDRLEPGRPTQRSLAPISRRALIGETGEAELRSAILQYNDGQNTVQLGKQQIVWGRADGIKLLDIVNPQSFREFILDDFDQSRTPLWSLQGETTLGGFDFQAIWVFDRSYNEAPPTNAVFDLTAPRFVPTLLETPIAPVTVADVERPDDFFGASDFGFQASGLVAGWNLGLNYFYGYEDTPYYDLETAGPNFTITPRFSRRHLVGGTFANAWGDFGLRGEISYAFDALVPEGLRFSAINRPAATSDTLRYVVGVDYYGVDDGLLSAQFFQTIRKDNVTDALTPTEEEYITLLAKKDFRNGDFGAELRWLSNLDDGDGLARLKTTWQITPDVFYVTLGFDVFYGETDGVFGQFDESDRATLTFKWFH